MNNRAFIYCRVSRFGVARGRKAAIPPPDEDGTDIVYVDGRDRP